MIVKKGAECIDGAMEVMSCEEFKGKLAAKGRETRGGVRLRPLPGPMILWSSTNSVLRHGDMALEMDKVANRDAWNPDQGA